MSCQPDPAATLKAARTSPDKHCTWPKVMMACSHKSVLLLGDIHCTCAAAVTAAAAGLSDFDRRKDRSRKNLRRPDTMLSWLGGCKLQHVERLPRSQLTFEVSMLAIVPVSS
jgi:hypothetical protein